MASDMQRQCNDHGTRHQAHARRARRAAQATRLGPAARSGSSHDPRPAAHDRRGAVRASLRRRSPLPWSATRQRGAPRHASRRLPPSRRVGLVAPPLRRRGRSAMVWHIAVVVAILASGYDLFLRVRAQRRQQVPGGTDELTRLENRRAFYELAGREFERARRYQHPFTIAYFDLDDFREVSRLLPQQVGDEMLRLVGGAARSSVRGSDVVARLGGDQFALLLPEAGPEAAGAAVKKLQQTLLELAEVTCLQPAESLEAAIGAADRLLHGAKAAGRDTFWSEVIMPQPIEGFEPTRLRRAYRVPPGFDLPMPPPLDRPR